MNDKYAKEIAKELKLIRRELEKQNKNNDYDYCAVDDNGNIVETFLK